MCIPQEETRESRREGRGKVREVHELERACILAVADVACVCVVLCCVVLVSRAICPRNMRKTTIFIYNAMQPYLIRRAPYNTRFIRVPFREPRPGGHPHLRECRRGEVSESGPVERRGRVGWLVGHAVLAWAASLELVTKDGWVAFRVGCWCEVICCQVRGCSILSGARRHWMGLGAFTTGNRGSAVRLYSQRLRRKKNKRNSVWRVTESHTIRISSEEIV